MNISKSLYTIGLQCEKYLWLKKYKKDVIIEDKSIQSKLKQGDDVGSLACELFPDGVEVEFDKTNLDNMIHDTKKLINNGVKNIYEASFKYDGVFIAIDILHINDDNSVEIYEVKSSTTIKDIYLHDTSIQYYVLNGLGYDVRKTSIVHINNNYTRDESLDITKLFSIVDVTDTIKKFQNDIPIHLKRFDTILQDRQNEPIVDIGEHCNKPYSCDAKEYCWRDIPDYSIFDIGNLRTKKKFELYKNNIIAFDDIVNIDDFSKTQQIQIISEQQNKTIINKDKIKEFLDTLTYPIYHLDFETFQQAIPQYKGIKPFMQIPFQYSLHIEQKDGSLDHREFLAICGIDPRYELAKHLVQDIPTDVTVLAYNMGFEKGVIKNLSIDFPQFSDKLMVIYDNIKDLMIPFKNKDYYIPTMKGSYSIKHILPALVPDMAKAYKELDFIQNGSDAMDTYPKLATIKDKNEVARLRKALLAYCKLDTLAMVKILERLRNTLE